MLALIVERLNDWIVSPRTLDRVERPVRLRATDAPPDQRDVPADFIRTVVRDLDALRRRAYADALQKDPPYDNSMNVVIPASAQARLRGYMLGMTIRWLEVIARVDDSGGTAPRSMRDASEVTLTDGMPLEIIDDLVRGMESDIRATEGVIARCAERRREKTQTSSIAPTVTKRRSSRAHV